MWNSEDILTRDSALNFGASLAREQHSLPTGFPAWDEACHGTGGKGLDDWWYIVLGGASNSGKTQLMRWLAKSAADAGHIPGIITMEVPLRGIQRQFYADLTSFGYYDLIPHKFTANGYEDRLKKLTDEVGEYGPRSIVVTEYDGRPRLSEVEEMAHGLRESGCSVIFIDHLQLVKPDARMDVAEAAEEASERLRIMAHRNGVLTVALSQLNRGASSQRDRSPTMHDLWGGTAMESNANQVVLLDHSRQERNESKLRTWLLVDKNREGPARVQIPVEIDFKGGTWREALQDEQDSWP